MTIVNSGGNLAVQAMGVRQTRETISGPFRHVLHKSPSESIPALIGRGDKPFLYCPNIILAFYVS